MHSDATPQFATQSFYCYGDACHIVDEARPSLITLSLDQNRYVPGDTARHQRLDDDPLTHDGRD